MKSKIVSIKNCARCGGDHVALEFIPFRCPPPGHSHWALCPINDEPVLLHVVDVPTAKKKKKS